MERRGETVGFGINGDGPQESAEDEVADTRLISSWSRTGMNHTCRKNLPFRGFSCEFVGAENGDVGVSLYFVEAAPGQGPPPHRHPYDEVAFIQEGSARWTVDGKSFEAHPGDILVVKAGEIHTFQNIGDGPLVQMDVHLSPRFIQENME
jgi:quercetin dioxygenase-like cupin family protein